MTDKAIVYGGPHPGFVRFHSFLGLAFFLTFVFRPDVILVLFVPSELKPNPVFNLLSQLYAVLGASVCASNVVEPILSRAHTLAHGGLVIAVCVILVAHRELIYSYVLWISVYFACAGVYLVIRSPNARVFSTSISQATHIKKTRDGSVRGRRVEKLA